jgi:hypothetical protein
MIVKIMPKSTKRRRVKQKKQKTTTLVFDRICGRSSVVSSDHETESHIFLGRFGAESNPDDGQEFGGTIEKTTVQHGPELILPGVDPSQILKRNLQERGHVGPRIAAPELSPRIASNELISSP